MADQDVTINRNFNINEKTVTITINNLQNEDLTIEASYQRNFNKQNIINITETKLEKKYSVVINLPDDFYTGNKLLTLEVTDNSGNKTSEIFNLNQGITGITSKIIKNTLIKKV